MSLVDNMRQWLAPNINTAQLIQHKDKDLWHQLVPDVRTEHGTCHLKRERERENYNTEVLMEKNIFETLK